MKRFIYIVLLVFALFIPIGQAVAQTWIPFDEQKDEKPLTVEILKSDRTEYQVKVTIHGLYDEKMVTEMGTFHRISMGLDSYSSRVGEPMLPLFTQTIAIPTGAKVTASISDEKWESIAIGIIYPVQEPLLETEQAKGFDYDETAYQKDCTPSLVSIGQKMLWRDISNTCIAVCPLKYYPLNDSLSVMTEFVLHVNFIYDKKEIDESYFEPDDPLRIFDNLPYAGSTIKGRQKKTNSLQVRSSNDYDFLIIVGNQAILSSDKMKEFRRWKALKGYKTKAVSTQTSGSDAHSIKSYIYQEYSNYNLKYVLFVGDNDLIPLYGMESPYNSLKWIRSDYWYGCLSGNDFQAEIPIGRFATNSLSEFCNMVDKTIRYENSYASSNNVLLVSHYDYLYYYQNCCNSIKDEDYNEPVTFSKAYGYDTTPNGINATNADVVNEINAGAHIVNYRGHGNVNFWGGPAPYTNWNNDGESFSTDEVNNMSDETCAVFFSVACNTGNIANHDTLSMLEVYTRSQHGAVAYLGASVPTYTGINHHFDRLLFKSLLNSSVYHFGDINLRAHVICIANNDSLNSSISDIPLTIAVDNAFCYICGGDPTLELWTAIPQKINANVNVVNGNVIINTNFCGNYNISIVSVNGELINRIPCSSGTCSFTLPGDQFYIAINRHNYFPYVFYYDTISDEIMPQTFYYDAYFENTSLTIGDPMAEGECVTVKKGNQVEINKGNGEVSIFPSFNCEKGAVFEIK